MRAVTRTLVALGAALVSGAVLEAQTQTVRMTERRMLRSDSLVDRLLVADVESVKRTVTAWSEREAQLLRELRALPESDVAGRRRLDEQLALHARDGFAIMSAVQARCIEEGAPRPPGYLGLNLTNGWKVENGEPRPLGTTVTSVEPGSPAERAGILRNDRILALAGLDATERTPDVSPQLLPGRTMTVRVDRNGQVKEYALVIARRPEGFGDSCGEFERALVPMRIAGPGRIVVDEPGTGPRRLILRGDEIDPREDLGNVRIEIFRPGAQNLTAVGYFGGAEFKMLDADWGEVLGVRQGVIVSAVASGTPASLSGLKSGDVVTAVGRAPVATPMILVQMLGAMDEREATLSVVRMKEKKTITFKWGQR